MRVILALAALAIFCSNYMNTWLHLDTICFVSPGEVERALDGYSISQPQSDHSADSFSFILSKKSLFQKTLPHKKTHRLRSIFTRGLGLFKNITPKSKLKPGSTNLLFVDPPLTSLSSLYPVVPRSPIQIRHDTLPEILSTRSMSQKRNQSLRRPRHNLGDGDSYSLLGEISNGGLLMYRDVYGHDDTDLVAYNSIDGIQEPQIGSTTVVMNDFIDDSNGRMFIDSLEVGFDNVQPDSMNASDIINEITGPTQEVNIINEITRPTEEFNINEIGHPTEEFNIVNDHNYSTQEIDVLSNNDSFHLDLESIYGASKPQVIKVAPDLYSIPLKPDSATDKTYLNQSSLKPTSSTTSNCENSWLQTKFEEDLRIIDEIMHNLRSSSTSGSSILTIQESYYSYSKSPSDGAIVAKRDQ